MSAATVEKLEPVTQVSVVENRAITPMDLLDRALQSGAGIDVLNKFMDMQDRWQANQNRMAFNASIAAAKAAIPIIKKNATGHNNKRYADFSAYASVVDPILGKHGLGYRFRTVQDDKTIRTTCILFHKDGHSEENTLQGPADQTGNKNAMQAIGSTLTYLQRYSLVQALGLAAAEDDDGKAGAASDKIGADEIETIRSMIDAAGGAPVQARLLKWARVEAVEDIPASLYDQAIANLQNVKRS